MKRRFVNGTMNSHKFDVKLQTRGFT